MSNLGLSMGSSPQQSPKRNKGKKRTAGFTIGSIIAIVVVLVIAAWGAVRILDVYRGADYTGTGEGAVVVVINPGDTVTRIGETLAAADVIESPRAFVNAAAGNPAATSLQPGTYNLREKMSASAALELLLDPSSRAVSKLTIPEGSRMSTVVTRAAQVSGLPESDFTAVLDNPVDLGLPSWAKNDAEGFLYPATYDVEPGATATSILSQMVKKFNEVSTEMNLEATAAEQGRNPYDVVITASLVEAEAGPQDFGKVARVVDNRLAANMPLQFDSTSNYASDSSNIQLSREQLNSDSPYNTYKVKGLPPTPIGQPGQPALQAALNPDEGDWLFFVTVDPDTKQTKFTANYQEFLTFVDELNEYLATHPDAKKTVG